jgi:hypothetical protein
MMFCHKLMLDSKNRGCIEIVEVGYDNFGVDISCWDLLLLTKSHACHAFFLSHHPRRFIFPAITERCYN